MIKKITLQIGPAVGSPPLNIETGSAMTIFVGPNNSGKSQALREIGLLCTEGGRPPHIISSVEFEENTPNSGRAHLEAIAVPLLANEAEQVAHMMVSQGEQRGWVHTDTFLKAFQDPNKNQRNYANLYLKYYVEQLTGSNRMRLLEPQPQNDLKSPGNTFGKLFTNDTKRKFVQQKVFDATGFYPVIDPTVGGYLKMVFSVEPPVNERSLEQTTLEYIGRARDLEQVSDGVKAYTGILLQVHVGDPKIIIIDEPEAFLHPALAHRLGRELATAATTQKKQVFIATHSPDFVMGAVTAGVAVNIVRLSYDGSVGTAKNLPSQELARLMRDPMLRSVGVVSGLFFNRVMVCEGDTDRSFYQEINQRLCERGDDRGMADSRFLNAQNKQTIPRIVEPLRKLGISAAAIVDIDIVKDGGVEWTRHLTACGIPTPDHVAYQTRRAKLLDALNAKNKEFKRNGGISLLDGEELRFARAFIEDLAQYGLFIVPRGEVEKWLEKHDLERGKKAWLDSIFEKMGSDSGDPKYIQPEQGDVWDFIGQIAQWQRNPKRRGLEF